MNRIPGFVLGATALVGIGLSWLITINTNPAFTREPSPYYSTRRAQRILCKEMCADRWIAGCDTACYLRYMPVKDNLER
jgi:hypothetical protein